MYAFWLGVTAYDEAKKFWIGGRHGGRERGDAGDGERREGRREEGRFEFKNTKALYVAPVV